MKRSLPNATSKYLMNKFVSEFIADRTKGMFCDEWWEPISTLLKDVRETFDAHAEMIAPIWDSDDTHKVYFLKFTASNAHLTKEYKYKITACAAGTVDEPWQKYDIIAYSTT